MQNGGSGEARTTNKGEPGKQIVKITNMTIYAYVHFLNALFKFNFRSKNETIIFTIESLLLNFIPKHYRSGCRKGPDKVQYLLVVGQLKVNVLILDSHCFC